MSVFARARKVSPDQTTVSLREHIEDLFIQVDSISDLLKLFRGSLTAKTKYSHSKKAF